MIRNVDIFKRVCNAVEELGVEIDCFFIAKEKGLNIHFDDFSPRWRKIMEVLVNCEDEEDMLSFKNLSEIGSLARDYLGGDLGYDEVEILEEFLENPEKFL